MTLLAQDIPSHSRLAYEAAHVRAGVPAREQVEAGPPDRLGHRSEGPALDGRGRPGVAPASGASIWVHDLGRPIEVKIATGRGEFEQAFQLLSSKYQARGYEGPS